MTQIDTSIDRFFDTPAVPVAPTGIDRFFDGPPAQPTPPTPEAPVVAPTEPAEPVVEPVETPAAPLPTKLVAIPGAAYGAGVYERQFDIPKMTDQEAATHLGVPRFKIAGFREKGDITFGENIGMMDKADIAAKIPLVAELVSIENSFQYDEHADTLKGYHEALKFHDDEIKRIQAGTAKIPEGFTTQTWAKNQLENREKVLDDMKQTDAAVYMDDYLTKRAELAVRRKDVWAQIGSGMAQLPKYMAEFFATGGVYAAGKTAGIKLLAKLGVKGMSAQLFGALVGTGVRVLSLPQLTIAGGMERTLPPVRRDARGAFIVTPSDKSKFKAYFDELATQYLTMLSEVSGGGITKGFEKLMPKTASVMKAWSGGKAASAVAFHGMPAEFGEEVIDKWLKKAADTMGIDTGEKNWFMTLEEAFVTAGVLAFPTAAGAAISAAERRKDGGVETEPEAPPETPAEAPVSPQVEKPPTTPSEAVSPEIAPVAPAEAPPEAAPAPVAEVEAPVEDEQQDPRAGKGGKAVAEVELYGRLGVDIDATEAEIRAAARERMAATHPDVGGDTAIFQSLQEADRILSDPVLREQYDQNGMKGVRKAQKQALKDAAAETLTRTAGEYGIPTEGRSRQDIAKDVAKARRSGRKKKAKPPVAKSATTETVDAKPAPAKPKPMGKPKKAMGKPSKLAPKPDKLEAKPDKLTPQVKVEEARTEEIRQMSFREASSIAKSRGLIKNVASTSLRQIQDVIIADEGLIQPAPAAEEAEAPISEAEVTELQQLFHDHPRQAQAKTEAMSTRQLIALDDSRKAKGDFDAVVRQEIAERSIAGKGDLTFAEWKQQQRDAAPAAEEAPAAKWVVRPATGQLPASIELVDADGKVLDTGPSYPAVGKGIQETRRRGALARANAEARSRNAALKKAAKLKPEKIELPDYAKKALERFSKRNRGSRPTSLIDPANIKDMMIVGVGVVDMLVKQGVNVAKQAWSKAMKGLMPYLDAATLDTVWDRTKAQREELIIKAKPEGPTKKQLAQGHIAAKKAGLLDDKGKTTGAYRKLAKKTTGKTSMADMTEAEAEAFIKAIDAIRPKKVGNKNVITEKTEQKIQTLKARLIARGELTEERFAQQLTELGLSTAQYVDRKTFLTEREGKALIRKMNDEALVIRPREEAIKALNKEANAGVAMIVDSLDTEIDRRRTKRPGPARVSQYKGARYVALDLQEQTGLPFHDIWNAMNNARLNIKTKIANITKRIVASSPEAAGIMKDAEASQLVNDYIASKRAKDPAPYPNDITAEEIKVAKTIETILKKFENHVRLARFMEHYYRKAEIPNAPEADLLEATDIYESEGLDAVSKYLDTRTWGIIKKGYEPHEAVTSKIVRGPRTIAFGKGHIKVRQDDGMGQDRTIFQRLDSYARQILNKVDLEPHVRALVRLHDENTGVFKDPASANKAIVLMVEEAKGFRDVPSSLQILVRRTVSQAFRATFLRPDLTIRNLHQNFAFNEDFLSGDLLDPRNKPLSQEDTDYFDNRVDMLAPIHQQYLMQEEKGIPGFGWLNKAAEKVQHYGLGDKWNRQWAFWGRINRLRRAFAGVDPGNRAAVKKAMNKGAFAGLELTQQRRAMEIMAQYGKDAMIRYAAGLHVLNVHFAYDRAQRSPVEMGSAGRTWGSLLAFPRSWAERMYRESRKVIHGGTHTSRYRALGRLIQMTIIPALVGELYKLWTGKDRNPYNPLNVLSWTPGGLVVGAVKVAGSVIYSTIQALQGDRDALGRIPSDLTRLANMYVPFYEIVTNILNASLDMEGVDRYAARKIREALDESYKVRDSSYEVERTWVEAAQRALGAKGAGKEPKKTGTLKITTDRKAIKRGG